MPVEIGLTDVAAVAIASLTALVTIFIIHQSNVSAKKIDDLENQLNSLKNKVGKSHLLSEEVERVTLDLHAKIQLVYSLIFFYKHTGDFSDVIIKRIREMKLVSDKHVYELELLSSNDAKRLSALQALTNGAGDVETLRVINQLIDIEQDDVRKAELKAFYEKLYSRLRGPLTYDSRAWTGR